MVVSAIFFVEFILVLCFDILASRLADVHTRANVTLRQLCYHVTSGMPTAHCTYGFANEGAREVAGGEGEDELAKQRR